LSSPQRRTGVHRVQSLKLDRVFPGIGRINISSGTDKRTIFREINAMLTALYSTARFDLLREIRESASRPIGQRISPLFLLDAFRRGRLDQLPTATTLRPLVEAFDAWTAGGNTRKGRAWSKWYAQAHRSVRKRVIATARAGATIADLPVMLAEHRAQYADRQKTFDNDRTILQAFVRDTCGRDSSVYREVARSESYRPRRQRTTQPQTVASLEQWTGKLDSETAAACWAMATTGMGPGEYWGQWERRIDRIVIFGTKREARERSVPDLGRCSEPPALSRQAFEDRLSEQTGGAFQPYDLRRTYANWLEEAGIRRARVRLYLGHRIRDVTDLYTDHDVTQFLREDARILRQWIAARTRQQPRHGIQATREA
jgi:integrase